MSALAIARLTALTHRANESHCEALSLSAAGLVKWQREAFGALLADWNKGHRSAKSAPNNVCQDVSEDTPWKRGDVNVFGSGTCFLDSLQLNRRADASI